jgi:predicted nucleic acid-binding protein
MDARGWARGVIVDTNIIIGFIDGTATDEANQQFTALQARNQIHVNEIIFAELSGRFPSANDLESLLRDMELKIIRMTLTACHRAGQAFNKYRRAGGERTSILPDFLIGAHAAENGWPILTRDRKGFASYFPEVKMIDPYKVQHD